MRELRVAALVKEGNSFNHDDIMSWQRASMLTSD